MSSYETHYTSGELVIATQRDDGFAADVTEQTFVGEKKVVSLPSDVRLVIEKLDKVGRYETRYKDGMLDGVQECYDAQNKLWYKCDWKEGLRDGVEAFTSTPVFRMTRWVKGKKDGAAVEWTCAGLSVLMYKDDRLVENPPCEMLVGKFDVTRWLFDREAEAHYVMMMGDGRVKFADATGKVIGTLAVGATHLAADGKHVYCSTQRGSFLGAAVAASSLAGVKVDGSVEGLCSYQPGKIVALIKTDDYRHVVSVVRTSGDALPVVESTYMLDTELTPELLSIGESLARGLNEAKQTARKYELVEKEVRQLPEAPSSATILSSSSALTSSALSSVTTPSSSLSSAVTLTSSALSSSLSAATTSTSSFPSSVALRSATTSTSSSLSFSPATSSSSVANPTLSSSLSPAATSTLSSSLSSVATPTLSSSLSSVTTPTLSSSLSSVATPTLSSSAATLSSSLRPPVPFPPNVERIDAIRTTPGGKIVVARWNGGFVVHDKEGRELENVRVPGLRSIELDGERLCYVVKEASAGYADDMVKLARPIEICAMSPGRLVVLCAKGEENFVLCHLCDKPLRVTETVPLQVREKVSFDCDMWRKSDASVIVATNPWNKYEVNIRTGEATPCREERPAPMLGQYKVVCKDYDRVCFEDTLPAIPRPSVFSGVNPDWVNIIPYSEKAVEARFCVPLSKVDDLQVDDLGRVVLLSTLDHFVLVVDTNGRELHRRAIRSPQCMVINKDVVYVGGPEGVWMDNKLIKLCAEGPVVGLCVLDNDTVVAIVHKDGKLRICTIVDGECSGTCCAVSGYAPPARPMAVEDWGREHVIIFWGAAFAGCRVNINTGTVVETRPYSDFKPNTRRSPPYSTSRVSGKTEVTVKVEPPHVKYTRLRTVVRGDFSVNKWLASNKKPSTSAAVLTTERSLYFVDKNERVFHHTGTAVQHLCAHGNTFYCVVLSSITSSRSGFWLEVPDIIGLTCLEDGRLVALTKKHFCFIKDAGGKLEFDSIKIPLSEEVGEREVHFMRQMEEHGLYVHCYSGQFFVDMQCGSVKPAARMVNLADKFCMRSTGRVEEIVQGPLSLPPPDSLETEGGNKVELDIASSAIVKTDASGRVLERIAVKDLHRTAIPGTVAVDGERVYYTDATSFGTDTNRVILAGTVLGAVRVTPGRFVVLCRTALQHMLRHVTGNPLKLESTVVVSGVGFYGQVTGMWQKDGGSVLVQLDNKRKFRVAIYTGVARENDAEPSRDPQKFEVNLPLASDQIYVTDSGNLVLISAADQSILKVDERGRVLERIASKERGSVIICGTVFADGERVFYVCKDGVRSSLDTKVLVPDIAGACCVAPGKIAAVCFNMGVVTVKTIHWATGTFKRSVPVCNAKYVAGVWKQDKSHIFLSVESGKRRTFLVDIRTGATKETSDVCIRPMLREWFVKTGCALPNGSKVFFERSNLELTDLKINVTRPTAVAVTPGEHFVVRGDAIVKVNLYGQELERIAASPWPGYVQHGGLVLDGEQIYYPAKDSFGTQSERITVPNIVGACWQSKGDFVAMSRPNTGFVRLDYISAAPLRIVRTTVLEKIANSTVRCVLGIWCAGQDVVLQIERESGEFCTVRVDSVTNQERVCQDPSPTLMFRGRELAFSSADATHVFYKTEPVPAKSLSPPPLASSLTVPPSFAGLPRISLFKPVRVPVPNVSALIRTKDGGLAVLSEDPRKLVFVPKDAAPETRPGTAKFLTRWNNTYAYATPYEIGIGSKAFYITGGIAGLCSLSSNKMLVLHGAPLHFCVFDECEDPKKVFARTIHDSILVRHEFPSADKVKYVCAVDDSTVLLAVGRNGPGIHPEDVVIKMAIDSGKCKPASASDLPSLRLVVHQVDSETVEIREQAEKSGPVFCAHE